jgi:L-fucose isomerase-like protein
MLVMSELNERGIATACEVDVGNAVAMRALGLASGGPATWLDWNSNYGDDDDKCILFHCGPVPSSLMKEKGAIPEQEIFVQTFGKGCTFGCNVGRLRSGAFTCSGACSRTRGKSGSTLEKGRSGMSMSQRSPSAARGWRRSRVCRTSFFISATMASAITSAWLAVA